MYYYIVLSCIMVWNGLNYWDVHRCVEWNNNFALTFPELPRPLRHLPWHTCQVTSVQRSPGSRQGLQSYHASMRVQDRKLVVVQGSFMLFSTAFARKGSKKNSRKRRRKLKCMWGASESARQGSCCLECWKHMPRSWLPGWTIESLNKLAVFGSENILRDCLTCQCEGCKANRKSCKMT